MTIAVTSSLSFCQICRVFKKSIIKTYLNSVLVIPPDGSRVLEVPGPSSQEAIKIQIMSPVSASYPDL
jgi:hypothetical protein